MWLQSVLHDELVSITWPPLCFDIKFSKADALNQNHIFPNSLVWQMKAPSNPVSGNFLSRIKVRLATDTPNTFIKLKGGITSGQ